MVTMPEYVPGTASCGTVIVIQTLEQSATDDSAGLSGLINVGKYRKRPVGMPTLSATDSTHAN
jgi:hypothetical protein